ncbi:hypothetical protein ACQUWS_19725, partial [Ralstonia pseudosolanacearum]
VFLLIAGELAEELARARAGDGAEVADGLWLNVGHGALGFTLAMGSAGLLADLIARRAPAIAAAPYALAR